MTARWAEVPEEVCTRVMAEIRRSAEDWRHSLRLPWVSDSMRTERVAIAEALDSALATLRDAAKGGERARIVAWLRRQNESELDVRARRTTEAYAQRIERGEYEET